MKADTRRWENAEGRDESPGSVTPPDEGQDLSVDRSSRDYGFRTTSVDVTIVRLFTLARSFRALTGISCSTNVASMYSVRLSDPTTVIFKGTTRSVSGQ